MKEKTYDSYYKKKRTKNASLHNSIHLTENEAKILINYYEDISLLANADCKNGYDVISFTEYIERTSIIESRLFQLRSLLNNQKRDDIKNEM